MIATKQAEGMPWASISQDQQPGRPVSSPDWRNHAKVKFLSVVPRAYQGATLADFDPQPKIDYSRQGIFIQGGTGIGKTHMATALLADMMRPEHERTSFICPAHESFTPTWSLCWQDVPGLLCRIRSSFRQTSRESEMDIIDAMVSVGVLLLDDLGAEKVSDFSAATLYTILSQRVNDERMTIVTTNQTLSEINDWEPRLASRLAEFAQVRLPYVDRRIAR